MHGIREFLNGLTILWSLENLDTKQPETSHHIGSVKWTNADKLHQITVDVLLFADLFGYGKYEKSWMYIKYFRVSLKIFQLDGLFEDLYEILMENLILQSHYEQLNFYEEH